MDASYELHNRKITALASNRFKNQTIDRFELLYHNRNHQGWSVRKGLWLSFVLVFH